VVDGLRALDEEGDGTEAERSRGRQRAVGDRQRADPENALGSDPERRLARDDEAQSRRRVVERHA
jgi:hypothetical protein